MYGFHLEPEPVQGENHPWLRDMPCYEKNTSPEAIVCLLPSGNASINLPSTSIPSNRPWICRSGKFTGHRLPDALRALDPGIAGWPLTPLSLIPLF
jgi:hypothetical protein